jgi:hypothetical protein
MSHDSTFIYDPARYKLDLPPLVLALQQVLVSGSGASGSR